MIRYPTGVEKDLYGDWRWIDYPRTVSFVANFGKIDGEIPLGQRVYG